MLIGFFSKYWLSVQCPTLYAVFQLAVFWVTRWEEVRDLWGAHFAVSHTACGWTFRWRWGIGGITETQNLGDNSSLCVFVLQHQNWDRKHGMYLWKCNGWTLKEMMTIFFSRFFGSWLAYYFSHDLWNPPYVTVAVTVMLVCFGKWKIDQCQTPNVH